MKRNFLILMVLVVGAIFVGTVFILLQLDKKKPVDVIDYNIRITDKKEFNKILRELKEAAQKDPHNALRWIEIAKLYNNVGDYEKAYLYLKKSLKMQPDFKYRESVQEIIDDYEEAKGIKK